MKVLFGIIISSILLLPINALAAERATMVHSIVNVTDSSTQITTGALRIMILQNLSDIAIWCNLAGATAVVGQGFVLNPTPIAGQGGGGIVLDIVIPNSAVTCIHGGTGNKELSVTVG